MKQINLLAGLGLFVALLLPSGAQAQREHEYRSGYHVPKPPAYRQHPPSYPAHPGYDGYHGHRKPVPRGDTYIIVEPRKSKAEQAYEDEVWLLKTERIRQLRQNMVAPRPPLPSK